MSVPSLTRRMAVAGLIWIAVLAATSAGQQPGQSVAVDADDIGGVVTSTKGPEAGVWVIAETTDLPTRFAKIVVTNDRGQYLIPDLPKANYNIWVRGYGLVDSAKVKSAPGKTLNLTAVVAPNPRAAAQYYPAQFWLALMQMPPVMIFAGKPNSRGQSVVSATAARCPPEDWPPI